MHSKSAREKWSREMVACDDRVERVQFALAYEKFALSDAADANGVRRQSVRLAVASLPTAIQRIRLSQINRVCRSQIKRDREQDDPLSFG